jgi:AraC-like DNA-binding protein
MLTGLIRQLPTRRPNVTVMGQGIVRVAALLGVSPILRARGVEPADVLASVGLDPGILDHPDNCIAYSSAGRLLQRCADATGCMHVGLLVGQHADISSLGMLGELMWRSPSVHAALRSLTLHLHLQTRGAVVTHGIEGRSATFGFAIYQLGMPGAAHAYDRVMAHEFNIMRALCGPRWRPIAVSFAHAKPRDVRPYRQFFGSALRFNADRTEIVFSKSWLEHAPPGFDAERHRALEREMAVQALLRPDDLAESVRRALRTMILGDHASETSICKLLSIPTRTLRRQLAAQGTTFRKLLEEGRYEVARQLLADTELTTAEIADALDYADASAFTRAFRRWTDTSPAAWRANTLATTRAGKRQDLTPVDSR